MAGPVKQLQIASVMIEVAVTSITLFLFCCGYPDEFRTVLWEAGGENGWNSNPRLRIYDYANHREPPAIPLIWSQSLTNSNLAIALLAVAICLARMALLFFDFGGFSLPIMYDIVMSGMWIYSVAAQSSPDFTDPIHPSPRPWYLERGCGGLHDQYYKACVVTKTSFAFSILSMLFYVSRLACYAFGFAYWCGKHSILENISNSLRAHLLKYNGNGRFDYVHVERWTKLDDAGCNICTDQEQLNPHAGERLLLPRSRTNSFDTASTYA